MIINRATFHQILANANGIFNAFMYGIQSAWTAPTLVKLKDSEDFTVSDEELSWIASSHEIGRVFGPLLAAILVDRIGRKYTLVMCSFSFFISWVIMAFTHSITLICCLRMLQGAAHGVNMVTCSIYLAENCIPKMRGIMNSIGLVNINIALIIGSVLTTYTSFSTAARINAAVGFCGLSTGFFLRETPYFLLMKGCVEEARKNLMWLKGKSVVDGEVESELEKINENIKHEILKKKSVLTALTFSENYKSILIIISIKFLISMNGFSAIMAYSPMIFQSSSLFSPSEYTIIMGIFLLMISIILLFIIERYNRRSLLICLSILVVICHVCTFSLILAEAYIPQQCLSWLIFTMISISLPSSSIMSNISHTISGELLPMSVKAIGNCLGTTAFSTAAAITVAIFLAVGALGIEYNFLLYSIAGILLFIFIIIAVPETRGKSLVDIQKSLQAKDDATK